MCVRGCRPIAAVKSCCFHWQTRRMIGKSGPTARADRRHDLGGEARALLDARAAEAVVALVGAVPEELVDQVAVRAVQLDRVEAEALARRRPRGRRRRWRRRCPRRSSPRRAACRGRRGRTGCRPAPAGSSPRHGCAPRRRARAAAPSCRPRRAPRRSPASSRPARPRRGSGTAGIVERGRAVDRPSPRR